MPARILLTLKQHRFETITVVVLCLGVAIAALVEAFRLSSIQFPANCTPANGYGYDPMAAPTACDLAVKRFYDIAWSFDMNMVKLFEQILPFIVGITLGAVLVAREIEQGTAPLSWALAGSRRRWLAGKLLAVIVVAVPLLLVAGLAADIRQGAMTPGVDPHASFESFTDRGIFLVFWGVAALLGTAALGTVTGRTLPAVLLALVICVLARGVWDQAWNRTILRPMAVVQGEEMNWATDLWVYQTDEYYLDGKPWMGEIEDWFRANTVCPDASPAAGATPGTVDGGAGSKGTAACTLRQGSMPPAPRNFVIPGDRYWSVVGLESAGLFLGAMLCGAAALFWVDRRRPY